MALKINNSYVKENIEDENGNIIGEIKFNPKDERIMKLLSDTVRNLTNKLNEQNAIGKLKNIEGLEEFTDNLEGLEQISEDIEKINKSIDLEYAAIFETIENFKQVFGEETMNVITGGCISLDNIIPLLNFVIPYVRDYRKSILGKYKNGNSTVFK